MSKKRIRRLGDILLDMEVLLIEMCVDHDLQWGDVFNLIRGYLEVHLPHAQEQYTKDDSRPMFYYGPAKTINKSELEEE